MSFVDKITALLKDSPPEFLFEISEAGLAYVRPGPTRQVGFEPIERDVVSVSPLRDNVLRPEALHHHIASVVGGETHKKRRKAVLILPDFATRVSVLDFDAMPDRAEERQQLIRFRMKKSVPFEVEDAALSFYPQPNGKGFAVVVVAAALEIVARYEAPFRAAGLHTGLVTTAAVTSIELDKSPGITLTAKLSGKALTISALKNGLLRLVRSVELPQVNQEEILNVLFPTIAYVEDELASKPDRLVLCGFENGSELEKELGVPVQAMRAKHGTPTPFNAGLLGYLESAA